MSFNKSVNGVTFTSDNFTNIDVHFDKQNLYTHIYISTTDNQAFNSNNVSDYQFVHDDNSLRVIIVMLENDNKTAKIYVYTSEFNKFNSYNIQQLPLKKTGSTQKLDKPSQPEKPYTLADAGLQCNDENATLKVTDNTATLTAASGYKITSAKITSTHHHIFKEKYDFTISEDGSSAAITLTPTKDLDYNLQVTTEENQPEKPYTLADVGLQCNDENATLKVTDNMATLTAVSGYKITSARITIKNHNIFRESHAFTISEDGSSATITLTPSKDLDYNLKVTTEEKPSEPQPQPSQPETKNFTGSIILKDDIKDKIKINFDNQRTVKISVIDNKYNINSLYYLYQLSPVGRVENSNNGFAINADKKTAILIIPDDLLNVSNLKIGGDIADTTPLKPETTTAKTQWVYMVDDKGLTELTKQAENNPKVGANPNYDFTEFINQLYYLPFTVDENLSDPTNKIYTGLRSLNVPSREMKDNVLNIDLGSINVIPENNNGFDYNIESIKLYLPLVLPIKIDFQDCYKKTISINYKINLLNGNATINISSNDKIISTFNQNVQTNLQMFNIYNNKDFGSLNNSINNELLTPYIKINYYKPVENLVSYETLEHNKLSSYTNFVKTRNASVSCGTQQEQQEIENLIDGGIYIK